MAIAMTASCGCRLLETGYGDDNIVVRSFPKNILAGIFGFPKMEKFEAEEGAEKAPKVKF